MKASMDVLNQILKKILSSKPELSKGLHEARILELWAKAMGETLSKHAKAVQVKGSTLFISVDQPVWRQELHSNKRLALQKLNRALIQELGTPNQREFWIEDLFFMGSPGTNGNPPKSNKWSPKK